MVHLDDRFAKDPDIVYRKVNGELILVPIRPKKGKETQFYSLEEVGGRIWELLDGRRCKEIIEEIVSEFDVGQEQAEKEVLLLVERLRKEGLIRRAS